MVEESELNRLFWHSRRGMLELDVLLVPFAREAFAQLNSEDQARYRTLLECEDQDMFAWFMHREAPPTADLQRIVDLVLEHSRARVSS